MTDIFSEVEEEVRRERYKQLWRRYGVYVIAIAAGIVIGVAGWQLWQNYDQSRRQAASTEFSNALNVAEAGDTAQAQGQFATMAEEAPGGYATLAEFQLARTQIAQGQRDEAIAGLRELIASDNPVLSAPARLELAWLLADSAPRDEVDTIIAPLRTDQNPWRFLAAEIAAYLDHRAGNRMEAISTYQALASDPGVPDGLRQRAGAIAQFLRANAPQATNTPDDQIPATGGAAPDDIAPDADIPAEEAPAE